jgi:hypothetical protein
VGFVFSQKNKEWTFRKKEGNVHLSIKGSKKIQPNLEQCVGLKPLRCGSFFWNMKHLELN